jgi:OmcA/MtrC family decaheme c-type cytochrome
MNQFQKSFRWAWSILMVCALAFAMGGCEGDDGAEGPVGPVGPVGPPGPPGTDLTEDPVASAVEAANFESCSTCHSGAGDQHQAFYDDYVDSTLAMTIDNVSSVAAGGGFDVTVDFSLTKDGAPYADDPANFDTYSFYVVQLQANGDFVNSGGYFPSFSATPMSNGDGTYTLTENLAYTPLAFNGGAIVGKVGLGELQFPDNPYNPGGGRRIMGYSDLATAAFEIGALDAWESAANVAGCESCHGVPYRKHANIEAVIAGVPEFTQCKACHSDDRSGGHPDWQYMVDDPFAWATGEAPTADYSYTANLMNDVHMSHAMEFPYPQSMANCTTCHDGKLGQVLDDENFVAETCKSCHVVQGIEAWPEDVLTNTVDQPEGLYAQPHRPPPMEFLWARAGVESFHNIDLTCTNCHGTDPGVPAFADYHSGYDDHIYDESGVKYADAYTVSVDNVSLVDNLMTIEFSASDPAIVPELLVSMYGWNTKHYVIGSHERDGNDACQGFRPGCQMEYVPESSGGGANPLFTEDAASVPGAWVVTLDLSALQPYKTDTIPQLILDGVITKAEVSLAPELELDGEEVILEAVSETFDLVGNALLADYFQGAETTVEIEKCNACHDVLASTFHTGSGRGGDSMQVCKACHATTFAGGHLEMQSRSIDSYVHAIHSFQPFDEDDVAAADDPVFDARNEMHKEHAFPNFSALSCEGCHREGTYNVPDQAASMPGVQSASWDIPDRSIGTFPEAVTGPASRACGSCHRAEWIKEDHAGDLASFNAHTAAFGTYVENDPVDADGDGLEEEPVLWGVIDKIMSLFE